MSITSRIRNKLKRPPPVVNYKKCYAQCGEDMIIAFIFGQLQLNTIRYLDIGCHHPFFLSNTAFFYENGSSGVCVEPDPILFKTIAKERKRDTCLNAGIGTTKQAHADFYIISEKTLNTFSKEDALRYESYGNKKIEQIIQVPLISINEVMAKYFDPFPNLVSLDAEGFDLEILKSMDFNTYRPQVFCIETLTYTENGTEEKILPIIDFMNQKDYFVYADTYINSIFIDKTIWNKK